MEYQIFGSNSIDTGLRADLLLSDKAFVAQGVTVGSTDFLAISGTGAFHVLKVAGTVFGDGMAIRLDNDSVVDSHQRVSIGAGGYVGSAGTAIALAGQNSTAVNAGMVSGRFGFSIGGAGEGNRR